MKKLFHLFSFLLQNIKWKMRPLAVLTSSGMSQMVFSHYSNKLSQQPKERVPVLLPYFVSPEQSKDQLVLGTFHFICKATFFSPLKIYLRKGTDLSRQNINTPSWDTLSPEDYNTLGKVLTQITGLYLSCISPLNFSFASYF